MNVPSWDNYYQNGMYNIPKTIIPRGTNYDKYQAIFPEGEHTYRGALNPDQYLQMQSLIPKPPTTTSFAPVPQAPIGSTFQPPVNAQPPRQGGNFHNALLGAMGGDTGALTGLLSPGTSPARPGRLSYKHKGAK